MTETPNEMQQVVDMIQGGEQLEGNPEYEELMAGLMQKKKMIDKTHSAVVQERQSKLTKHKADRKRKRKLAKKQKRQSRRK